MLPTLPQRQSLDQTRKSVRGVIPANRRQSQILEGKESISENTRREKSPDEEPFVSYRFFKNPNEIWTPGQPGSHTAQKPKLSGLPSASESTLEAIGDIVHDSFHSDPVRDRAGMYGMYGAPKGRDSLHQEFMDQLWVLLNSQGQKGYSDDVKVNGFTPDTWQRISKLQEYREKIRETEKQLKRDRPMGVRKADAESSTVPLPAITVASVTKPKPAHRHKKSEAQISRDTQSHDKSDHILPLGVNRLNRKFQASYKTVLDLLSKHPFETGVERTEEQKQLLHSCLRNHGALKKLSDAAFEQICGCLRLESIPANKIIFSQGDPGNCWYIILLGHVRIKANKPIKETGGIAEEPKTVATLGPGEGFGDHGLQNESVRGASAISASEPVYLVRVDKSDYKKIMRLLKACEDREKIFFLKHVPLLKFFNLGALGTVASHLTFRTFEAGAKIIKEGEVIDTVYFLKSGSASVYRSVDIVTESGEVKTKSLLLDELHKGDTINEGLLMDRANYRGSPITVIAKEDIEFAGILPYGAWTQLEFFYEPPAYLSWTTIDMQRLHHQRVNQRKFSKLSSQVLTQLSENRETLKRVKKGLL